MTGSPNGKRGVTPLVEQHYEALYRYAYRLSGSAADADDLTQDTFCKAHEQFSQLRDATRAKNWLFRILRNLYLHRLRTEKHGKSVSLELVGDLPQQEPDESMDLARDLQSVLNELTEDWRTPIILFYFEDFTYRDIAEQMDLPLGTVMSRLARAKAFLRQRLTPSPTGAIEDRSGNNG